MRLRTQQSGAGAGVNDGSRIADSLEEGGCKRPVVLAQTR
jgi:hypothetical protein